MKADLIVNLICAGLPFFIISSKRVPALKMHPILAALLRWTVFLILITACAFFFDTSLWLTGKEMKPRMVITGGLIFAPVSFLAALLYSWYCKRLYAQEMNEFEPVDADNPCNPPRNSKNQLDD